MRFRQAFITAAFVALVAWLLLREASAWAKFNWGSLETQLRDIRIISVLSGIVLIYLAYTVRALRWKLLMKPLRNAAVLSLLRATVIGFAAMALLGRPAELIRPYLIARQAGTSMSSQLAIWVLERMFDVAASVMLVAAALFISTELRALPYVVEFGRAAFVLGCLLALGGFCAVFVACYGGRLGGKLWRLLTPLSPVLAGRAAQFSSDFAEGVSAVRDPAALVAVAGLSVVMWVTIGCAYMEVIHGFPEPLREMRFSSVLLLMGFSLLGSMVQFPGGGASQLIVVAALLNVFRVPAESALSCGIVLWLTTYMIPVPVGLALLRKEHLSLKLIARRIREGGDQEIGP